MKKKIRCALWSAIVLSVGCASAGRMNGEQGPIDLLEHFEETSQVIPGEPCQVLRMDLDLTGDGVKELLLAKGAADGRSGEQEWLLYFSVGNGQYRHIGLLDFSFQMFRIDDQKRVLIYDKGLGVLVKYRVDGNGPHEEVRQGAGVVGGPEWALFKEWREREHLRVLSADLRGLTTSTNPTWTDLVSAEPVAGVGRLEGTVVR